jgi:predicted RNA-binding Zn ribbon-like protein
MHPLALDPDGYAGTYKLVGGRPALDFVNTVSWPGTDRHHDWLAVPANVTRWLTAVGLPAVDVGDDDLDAIADLRAAVDDALRPLARRARPTLAAIGRFNAALAGASARRLIDATTLRWTWPPPATPAQALDPVVVDAAEILAGADTSRLKRCPACDWLFQDRTRNCGRRWCDMADCGSRSKARAYYRRSKARPS